MLLLTTLLLLLPITAQSTPPEASPFEPVRVEGVLDPAVHGIWRSRGYGWLAEIRADRTRIFDHSPAGTLEQTVDPEALLAGSHFRRIGGVLQLTGIPGSSTIYTWDPLPELPASCDTPPASDPVSVFDYFCGIMREHYAYFEERGVDWETRREKHRPRVGAETTDDELWELLCDMLRGFRDDHMSLSGEVDGEERSFDDGYCRELDPALESGFAAQEAVATFAQFRSQWYAHYRAHVLNDLLGGEYRVGASDQVLWGRIGPLGYINVRGMGGFAESEDARDEVAGVHELMSRVLTDLAECDGVILDITLNTGGYDEVQMAIASHFVDEPRVGFRKIPLDAEGVELQPFHLHPAEGTRYLGPVSLVTSDFTVSAGEDFTLAMRELPHVTHRGVATRGAFSDILTKQLPNGWELNLSNEAYLDVDGSNWEAKGVPPEDPIPIFTRENLEYAHHDAILAVVDRMIAEGN